MRVPGRINLIRAPRGRLEVKEAYEFFAGVGGDGKPRWVISPAGRKPAWEDAVNGTHRMAVSFNPVLKRYLLTTIRRVREEGWFAIYDAPEPWGPWTLAHCERNPERWGSEFHTMPSAVEREGRRSHSHRAETPSG
ncbi:MAG: hypothetical protein ACE15B_04130 [Bryobacteraceae bacterium]